MSCCLVLCVQMRRVCLLLAVLAVGALTVADAATSARRGVVIDPNYHSNAEAVSQYSAEVQYRDDSSAEAVADAENNAADAEAEEEDVSFVSVGESDDNGIYYDAANMPSWLVPPWVTPNSPTGPLIPTYGSGYLTKTFNIKQWKGAVPPQPVFPLDSGYAYAAVDSDHHPQGGVFPNDARYHSPSLTVTAPIFAELQTTVTATEEDAEDAEGDDTEEVADDMSESPALMELANDEPILSHAEADASTILLHIAEDAYAFLDLADQVDTETEAETEAEADAKVENTATVQLDLTQLPRLVPLQPHVSADEAVEQYHTLKAFLDAEDAATAEQRDVSEDASFLEVADSDEDEDEEAEEEEDQEAEAEESFVELDTETDSEADAEAENTATVQLDLTQLPRLVPLQPHVSAEDAVEQYHTLKAFLDAEDAATAEQQDVSEDASFLEVDSDDEEDEEDSDEDEAEEEADEEEDMSFVELDAETDSEAEADAENTATVQLDLTQLPRLVPLQPHVSADEAVEQYNELKAFLDAEDAATAEQQDVSEDASFLEVASDDEEEDSDEDEEDSDEDEEDSDEEEAADEEADEEDMAFVELDAETDSEADAEAEHTATVQLDLTKLPRLVPLQPHVSAEDAAEQYHTLKAFLDAEDAATAEQQDVSEDASLLEVASDEEDEEDSDEEEEDSEEDSDEDEVDEEADEEEDMSFVELDSETDSESDESTLQLDLTKLPRLVPLQPHVSAEEAVEQYDTLKSFLDSAEQRDL